MRAATTAVTAVAAAAAGKSSADACSRSCVLSQSVQYLQLYSFLFDDSVPSVLVFADSATPPSWLSSVAVKYKARWGQLPPGANLASPLHPRILSSERARGSSAWPAAESPGGGSAPAAASASAPAQEGKKRTVNFGFVGKDVEPPVAPKFGLKKLPAAVVVVPTGDGQGYFVPFKGALPDKARPPPSHAAATVFRRDVRVLARARCSAHSATSAPPPPAGVRRGQGREGVCGRGGARRRGGGRAHARARLPAAGQAPEARGCARGAAACACACHRERTAQRSAHHALHAARPWPRLSTLPCCGVDSSAAVSQTLRSRS